ICSWTFTSTHLSFSQVLALHTSASLHEGKLIVYTSKGYGISDVRRVLHSHCPDECTRAVLNSRLFFNSREQYAKSRSRRESCAIAGCMANRPSVLGSTENKGFVPSLMSDVHYHPAYVFLD
ncbi:hypothetical protein BC939DRAFT_457378, partial [Gamsiella multidivaricata]|uniref:uncharacterized protein n=1 Tax=Gamsiella multidivaricata TaxID=101098 RepID=UPI0022211EE9